MKKLALAIALTTFSTQSYGAWSYHTEIEQGFEKRIAKSSDGIVTFTVIPDLKKATFVIDHEDYETMRISPPKADITGDRYDGLSFSYYYEEHRVNGRVTNYTYEGLAGSYDDLAESFMVGSSLTVTKNSTWSSSSKLLNSVSLRGSTKAIKSACLGLSCSTFTTDIDMSGNATAIQNQVREVKALKLEQELKAAQEAELAKRAELKAAQEAELARIDTYSKSPEGIAKLKAYVELEKAAIKEKHDQQIQQLQILGAILVIMLLGVSAWITPWTKEQKEAARVKETAKLKKKEQEVTLAKEKARVAKEEEQEAIRRVEAADQARKIAEQDTAIANYTNKVDGQIPALMRSHGEYMILKGIDASQIIQSTAILLSNNHGTLVSPSQVLKSSKYTLDLTRQHPDLDADTLVKLVLNNSATTKHTTKLMKKVGAGLAVGAGIALGSIG